MCTKAIRRGEDALKSNHLVKSFIGMFTISNKTQNHLEELKVKIIDTKFQVVDRRTD
jgi:hypothetical protein